MSMGFITLAHPEPFDSPLILSRSKDERLAQDRPVEGRAVLLVVRPFESLRVAPSRVEGRQAQHEREVHMLRYALDDPDDELDEDEDEDEDDTVEDGDDEEDDEDEDEEEEETWQVSAPLRVRQVLGPSSLRVRLSLTSLYELLD